MARKQKLTIWHKPNCSKSIAAMKFLREHEITPDTVFLYLETPPSEDEIRDVLKKLNIPAEQLVRKKESVFSEKFAGKKMTEEKWIKALVKYPVLIQRPIIIKGSKAVFGRSVEELNSII
ncbi:MAG: arsenate reductase (glutaredoxin) [Bacteroidia bacterium]|nr:arsenate reductase (glutaredoxin) [Bacteroidia bacterium]